MRIGLHLNLSQRLVVTPQLQQAIKLLQLSQLELSQEVRQQVIENPLLEEALEDAPSSDLEGASSQASSDNGGDVDEEARGPSDEHGASESSDETDFIWQSESDWDFDDSEEYATSRSEERPSYDQILTTPTSYIEHLLWQLRLSSASEHEKRIGEVLIGNINEDGYLPCPLSEICETMGIPLTMAESALTLIQGFDPPGVGARSLTECLLIQIAQLHCAGSLLEEIVTHHLETVQKRDYQKIARSCHADLAAVQQACAIISRLEPKPCRPFCATDNPTMVPDVTVVQRDGAYIATLNEDGLPRLRINAFYRNLMRSKESTPKPTRTYLRERFRSALWLVRSIEQRNQTIQRVAQSIVNFQSEFLKNGIGCLKPLILKQVAEDISMHESTVSRVTTRKYMDTPQGIYEMKFFFTGSLPRAGDTGESACSSTVVREMIRSIVKGEDVSHPLRDQEIVERLGRARIEIARRTVSKYRMLLKIPSASQRRGAFP